MVLDMIPLKDQFENGSNMIVSIVYRLIVDFLNDHKFLPPVLFLNLDNCGRENKVSLLYDKCFIKLENQICGSLKSTYDLKQPNFVELELRLSLQVNTDIMKLLVL